MSKKELEYQDLCKLIYPISNNQPNKKPISCQSKCNKGNSINWISVMSKRYQTVSYKTGVEIEYRQIGIASLSPVSFNEILKALKKKTAIKTFDLLTTQIDKLSKQLNCSIRLEIVINTTDNEGKARCNALIQEVDNNG